MGDAVMTNLTPERKSRKMGSLLSDRPSELRFQVLINSDGFANEHIQDKSDSDLEIVVRELLQNSLDAGANRINLRIEEVPVDAINGIAEYREAFKSACEVRWRHLETSAVEKRIADQIRETLENETISVLLCIDDGSGIAPEDMEAVLWAGNTTKAKDGGKGGSFGVGHCAAFKLSDLRYVLYATRSRDSSGKLSEFAAGSAVLAEHKQDGETRSPKGFYVAELAEREDGQKAAYSKPDGKMAEWLQEATRDGLMPAGATGTIVAVIGFRKGTKETEKICDAAAKNFYEAFSKGGLSLNVKSGSKTGKVNSTNIADRMKYLRNDKAPQKKGLLRGCWAASQYRTLATEKKIVDNKNATVRLRKWKTEEYGTGAARDIAICRNGMWIVRNGAPKLVPRDFAESRPFQCVISVKPESELDQLVKAAEGPEHIGLSYLQEMPKKDRERLNKLLGDLGKKISEAAGTVDDSEEYFLPDFAVLSGSKEENAEPLPDSPKPSPPNPDPDIPDIPPDPPPVPEPKPFTDKPFTEGVTISVLPVADRGQVSRILCSLEIDTEIDLPDKLGFRVESHSGSDATCDSWLSRETLKTESDSTEDETGGLIFIEAKHIMLAEIPLQKPIDAQEANALKITTMQRIRKQEE